jgi:phage shock protein A
MSPPRQPRTLRSLPPRGSRLRRQVAATAKLEGVAAEFALLAQRRARLHRQIELLERQLRAAGGTLSQVEARMHHLSAHMHITDDAAPMADGAAAAAPAPAPAPRARSRRNLVLQY